MFDDEEKNNSNNENETSDSEYEAFSYNDEEDINFSPTYTNRRLQKKRLERKMRKGNVWVSRLFVLFRLVILAGIIYGFYFLVKSPQWFVDKDIFTSSSQNLEIINNNIVPTYKILNELRKISVVNEPIYKFETDKIRVNLLELEPIEDIYIRRFWFPARLRIIVKERVPLISIYNQVGGEEVAYFTKDGVLIGSEYLPLPQQFKTIHVIAGGNFRSWDKAQIQNISKLVNYVEFLSKEPVNYVDLRKADDVYIDIPTAMLRAGVLDDGISDRVSRITSILPKVKQLKEPIQYVDLRWKGAAYLKKGNRISPASSNPELQSENGNENGNDNLMETEFEYDTDNQEEQTEELEG